MTDYKDNVYKNEADYYSILEGVPLLDTNDDSNGNALPTRCDPGRFPGNRRSPMLPAGPPDGSVLIQTAGNALQAVPAAALVPNRSSNGGGAVVAVQVPANAKPGDTLLVRAPPLGNDSVGDANAMVEATVPIGAWPGHTFLVEFPDPPYQQFVMSVMGLADESEESNATAAAAAGSAAVVAGHDVADDLHLNVVAAADEESPFAEAATSTAAPPFPVVETTAVDRNNSDPNLVLVRVPEGVERGSKLRVPVPDGRTMEATVPLDPTVTEFYLRVPPPPPSSWHDHPIVAVAAAPFAYYNV